MNVVNVDLNLRKMDTGTLEIKLTQGAISIATQLAPEQVEKLKESLSQFLGLPTIAIARNGALAVR